MHEVKKRFSIALDIKRESSNREFEVVEGDNGNEFVVSLFDGGTPVDLTGCLVLAVFKKSDGSSAQQDSAGHGITLDPEESNRFTVSLYITSFTSGKVESEIQVYSGADNSTLVTSAKFRFKCRKGIFLPETVEATDEYPLLVKMVSDMTALEEGVSAAEAGRISRDAAFSVFEEYDPAKEYVPLNKVSFNGSSYQNRSSCTGVEPTDREHWLLIAAKGESTGDMLKCVYDPEGKERDIFAYADCSAAAALEAAPVKAAPGDGDALVLFGGDGLIRKSGWADVRAALSNDFAAKNPPQYVLVLPAEGWSPEAPFSVTVPAPGVTEGQIYDIDLVRPADPAARALEQEGWNRVSDIKEVEGGFLFLCDEEKPGLPVTFRAIYRCEGEVS